MLSQQDENLKRIEPKEQQPEHPGRPSPSVFEPDRKKVMEQIKLRRAKLEQIKTHIPLKTYHSLLEKLDKEESGLKQKLTVKEQQVKKENQEQALPKIFFEQKFLKPKAIRID